MALVAIVVLMVTGCDWMSIYGRWQTSDGQCFEITTDGRYYELGQLSNGAWIIAKKSNFRIVSGSSSGGIYVAGSESYSFESADGVFLITNQRTGRTVTATRMSTYSFEPIGIVGTWRCTDQYSQNWVETYTSDGHYVMSSDQCEGTPEDFHIISGDIHEGVFELAEMQFEFDVTGTTLTVKPLDANYTWHGTFVY